MTGLFYFTTTIFVIMSLFLILLILIQKGRGGGLASAFGGAGGQTAFGSKTGDVLTWATSIVFGLFLVLAVALNLMANHIDAARTGYTAAPSKSNIPDLPAAPTGDPGIAQKPPMDTNVHPTTATAPSAVSSTTLPTTLPAVSIPAVSIPAVSIPASLPVAVPTTVPTTLP